MNKYLNYTINEFIWDESFRKWVLTPTRETNDRWQKWLIEHPDKANTVEQARGVVQSLTLFDLHLTDSEIKNAVQQTMNRAKHKPSADRLHPNLQTPVRSLFHYRWVGLAAMAVLLAGISFWVWTQRMSPTGQGPQVISYEGLVKSQKIALTETRNLSGKSMPVKLSDGSLVILKPGGQLSYSATFNGSRREVFLSGEAFFEVSKNPDKPFLIYAHGLITKVLGTSFIIKAYPADPNVTVEVKTGRVAVFAQSDPNVKEKTGNRELEGIVLMPNQRIVYDRDEVRLSKSLVENPQLIAGPSVKTNFVFEDTPIPRVFETLEKAYSVDIVFDEELLANCPLTAGLTDQPLFEKLDIICRVIEARYEIIDGQIIIYSRGCNL
jgi:transmembrane sensor